MILKNTIGILKKHKNFKSRYIPLRNVDVWLPPEYAVEGAKMYPVVYMHDGQNLFDPTSANINVDWGLDETLAGLIQAGKIPALIVVGIWSSENRWREYMPQKALELPQAAQARNEFIAQQGGEPYSERYLKFIIEELMPYMNQHYRTLPERKTTYIIGSSMGGLVSLYALCEYPQIFRAAGCLSTHWPAGGGMVVEYLRGALPVPGQHKLYFDYGTETLDADYEDYQIEVNQILRTSGYIPGVDWLTQKFPGAEHSERAWRERVHIPIEFLLS